jgi:parallel beta-helix repeat protein
MTSKSAAHAFLTSGLAPALVLACSIGCTASHGADGGAQGGGGVQENGGGDRGKGGQGSGGQVSGGTHGPGGAVGSGGASQGGASGSGAGGASGSGSGGASGAGSGGMAGSGAGGIGPGKGGGSGAGAGGSQGSGGAAKGGAAGANDAAVASGGVSGSGSGGVATGGASGSGGTTTPSTCDPTPPSGTYYVASPSGTGSTCSDASPCSASTAVGKLSAGQTAYLKGGTYTSGLTISKSGSAGSPVIIANYPCELPIIDSGGVNIQGTFVSLRGIVSRNASTGFGNKWTGSGTTNSNGDVEFINCIADMHSANGIAFRSAKGVHIKQCITAHTGFSTSNSWSSGVDLYGAQGTYQDNIIEQSVSFENMDNQQHTDGSGFIVDDIGTGATFVNNIGFRNGGSCIRLTTSSGTHIINNTCYGNGLDSAASNPSTPDEIFFSGGKTQDGVVMVNNAAVATGKGGDTQAIFGAPSATVSNNYTDNKNTISQWTDATGTNPDFHLTSSATALIGKGTTTEAPSEDIGFDPKCITKTAPTGTGVQSWWLYSIDYDYIKNVGGVAQCFHPKTRAGTPDIGAYAMTP